MHSAAEPPPSTNEAVGLLDLGATDQVDWIFELLFGRGPIERDQAIRAAAESLRDLGLCSHTSLAASDPLYRAIDRAIELGVRRRRFDEPRAGAIRAVR